MALRLLKGHDISQLSCLARSGELHGHLLTQTTNLLNFGASADYTCIGGDVEN